MRDLLPDTPEPTKTFVLVGFGLCLAIIFGGGLILLATMAEKHGPPFVHMSEPDPAPDCSAMTLEDRKELRRFVEVCANSTTSMLGCISKAEEMFCKQPRRER